MRLHETNDTGALPPVFVMNTYYTGIGIARNLYGYGIEVCGLSSEADAPGVRSRFFKRIYRVPNDRDEPESLCRQLLELRRQHNADPVIFPTRDFDVMFLENYRRRLEPLYRIPQNPAAEHLLDKLSLFKLAKDNDIAVPETRVCSSLEEIDREARTMRFPLVVKPRVAAQWRRKGAWSAVGARKAFLVESAEELRAQYTQISSISPEVMIQEYVNGDDTDIAVCCGFMDAEHELTAHFTARKLRQNPPLFGTGCAVETVDIPEIVPIAKRLLKAARYTGIAEVEFKRDCSNGKWFLIEVNPRHWDQHEIGTHIGVNLSLIAYEHTVGRPIHRAAVSPKPVPQFRWIAETEVLWSVLRNGYGRFQQSGRSGSLMRQLQTHYWTVRDISREIFFLLRGRKVFAIFHRRDPIPGILLCFRTARELGWKLARSWQHEN